MLDAAASRRRASRGVNQVGKLSKHGEVFPAHGLRERRVQLCIKLGRIEWNKGRSRYANKESAYGKG
jgi:hypothetical protein